MSSSQQLYTRVSTKLQALHPTMHLKRLKVWVWVVVSLIQGQSVQLSEIANHIPTHTQAVSRIARIRRFSPFDWYSQLGQVKGWYALSLTFVK